MKSPLNKELVYLMLRCEADVYLQNPCGSLRIYSATTTVAWRTILSPSL